MTASRSSLETEPEGSGKRTLGGLERGLGKKLSLKEEFGKGTERRDGKTESNIS